MSWLVPRPKGDTIRCEKFGGIIEKYGEKILKAVNDEVRRINVQVDGNVMQSYLSQLHGQYQGIKSKRDEPYMLDIKFPHNFVWDQKKGLYSSFAELVAVTLEIAHLNPGHSSYIFQIYNRLVGQTASEFEEVSSLLEELGINVLDYREMSILKIDEHHHADFGNTDFDKSGVVNYTPDIAPAYAEFLKKYPTGLFTDESFPQLYYLSEIYLNLSGTLNFDNWGADRSINDTITNEVNHGNIGSCFYVLVGVKIVAKIQQQIQVAQVHGVSRFLGVQLPPDLPVEGGHANMIQFTHHKDHFELFMFEPHGQSRRAPGKWYGIPQKFLEVLAVHLKHVRGIKCVVNTGFCPRVQGELPFCAMYSIYFSVLDHLNKKLTQRERKLMIEWMCSSARDRGPDESRSQYMSPKNANSVQKLTAEQKQGWLTHVDVPGFQDAHNDTCSIDTIILMLVAFYGIGEKQLYANVRMSTGYRPRAYNSRSPGARAPSSAAHSSFADKSGSISRSRAPSSRAHNARSRF